MQSPRVPPPPASGRRLSRWDSFDEAARRLVAGEIDFEAFCRAARRDFERLARIAARKRPPRGMGEDDLVSLGMYYAWHYLFCHAARSGKIGFDPERGKAPGLYVRWNVAKKLQKELSIARGENQHRRDTTTARQQDVALESYAGSNDGGGQRVRDVVIEEELSITAEMSAEEMLDHRRLVEAFGPELRLVAASGSDEDDVAACRLLDAAASGLRGATMTFAGATEVLSRVAVDLDVQRAREKVRTMEKNAVLGSTKIVAINRIAVRVNYERITGKSAEGISTEKLVPLLEEHFSKSPNGHDSQCNICEGWSNAAEAPDACPYCNDGEGIVAGEVSKEPEPEAATDPRGSVAPANDEATAIDASKIIFDESEKPTKATKAEVQERKMVRRPPTPPKPSAGLTMLAGGRSAASSSGDLDKSIKSFFQAAGGMAAGHYMMGVELIKIRDHLWQFRVSEDGKPKYKSFDQFYEGELQISKSSANRLINLAENFTKDQAEAFGPRMLAVVAAAPKEAHAVLLAKAEAGTSTREMEKEVQSAKAAAGIKTSSEASGRRVPATNAATKAAAEARREKRERQESAAITVGLRAKSFTSALYARGALAGQFPSAEPSKATLPAELADAIRSLQLFATIEGINGVAITVGIHVDASGALSLKGEAARQKEEDAAA